MKKMACQAMQMWSLSCLVAAFLDLAIAYLLLCASAVAYLVSKCLGFFGLSLPCPSCDGMFLNIDNKNLCLNRALVEFPVQKVSDVQFSVKQKFPFNGSMFPQNQNYAIAGNNCGNGVLEIEGEASCSSVSGDLVKNEEFDMKGKGVLSHRLRGRRLRQRRKRGGGDHGEYLAVSSYERPLSKDDLGGDPPSDSSTNKGGSGLIGGGLLSVDSDAVARYLEYNNKGPKITALSTDEDIPIKKVVTSIDGPEDAKNAIKILEQALEEEQIARAALYVDLEKERSAAASAADEAMAMILRLQEEKASIEMEARQYQRIFEEKSVYDLEEMNILKEILVRREREKHFLENEVEGFRQMMVSVENEDPNDDPVMILHQLIANNDEKKVKIEENSNLEFGNEPPTKPRDEKSNLEKVIEKNSNLEFGNESPIQSREEKSNLEEKEMISQENKILEKNIIETNDLTLDKDSNVYDVHVIESEVDVKKGGSSEICGSGLPPKGPKGSRRGSMSPLDCEMMKIDSEVGRLRERLKHVQEGREKLSMPLENRERENVQLKLLEDIARQVQEIRHLTVPGKALRQGSLPLPNSKGFSKKRRCRSVSSGIKL